MKGICKQFSGTQILHSVDFELNYGEVHALVGENGAGKSTLIKVLAGVHMADSGEVLLEGNPIKIRSPKDAFNLGITTIHQEFNLVPHLDVAANIFLGRETRQGIGVINSKKMYKETKRLLERIGAEIDPKEPISHLGVAEKQMIEICKALSLNAKVVIMDEPTAVLSNKEIDRLFNVIRSIQAEGISTIYISHRLDELKEIADRVSVLRDGCLIGELNKEKMSKDTITTMMIGRQLTEQFPKSDKQIGDIVFKVESLKRDNVIEDISFEVRKGEILGFSGLVGSGRTEIARAIVGLDKIDGGDIYLDGKKTTIRSPFNAKQQGIVLVPEERKNDGLILILSVENNISLPYLGKMGNGFVVSQKKADAVSEKFVKAMNIKPGKISTIVRNMSGGNQQKVSIAKWIYEHHKVMIFDEPTRGIDVGAKSEIYKIMQDLAKNGLAIIMISSDLPEIIGMSDRVIVMKEGKISGELDKNDLSEQAVMDLAF
jgi:ribose transport system ATP-binding protein